MNRLLLQIVFAVGLIAVLLPIGSRAGDASAPPSLTLASPTLEIAFPQRKSLIQFFYLSQPDEEPNIEVYLSHRSGNDIRTVHLETVEPQGRAAEIKSVFTLDTADGMERRLFIIVGWPVRLAAIGTEGTYYEVFVYGLNSSDDQQVEFPRARDVEAKLGSGLDGTREGESVAFPYKDFESVRTALIQYPSG